MLLGLAEVFGILSVLAVGLLFNPKISTQVYDWKTNPFSYHPLLMTVGLLFCYGNAIVVYRTFKQTPKLTVKILHAFLLLSSFIFAAIGFVAIVRSKLEGKRAQFMTYHTWIGLATLILFALQWICGFISFLLPKLSLELRQAYMPR
jgi:cytochrome b-561